MNKIREIRILCRRNVGTQVQFVRKASYYIYNPTRFSAIRLEGIIDALADWGEGRFELRLYPSRVEVTYTLPVDYYDGLLELSELLG